MKALPCFCSFLFMLTACQHPPATPPAEPPYQKPASFKVTGSRYLGKIERLDPRLDEILARDAKLEKLAEGFDWSEGPVWLKRGQVLVFSDVPQNVVYRYIEGQGVSEYLKPSGYTGSTPRGGEPGSNGLTVDSEGRLVLCEHGDRRVARLEQDKTKTTLADRYQGKRFNSPNDLVYHSNGDLYFTDPPYGLEGKNDDPKKELPFNGVYRLKKNGQVTLLTDQLTFPNGLAFSPDEKTLYVAVSDPARAIWMAYDVKTDGTIENGRVFFDSTSMVKKKKKGLPDGLKVDARGNLWATGPGGVFIFSPDGKHLGTLATGEATANCNWGDDGSTLYVTADMYICRIRTKTRGAKF
jgi:gluconolactonase